MKKKMMLFLSVVSLSLIFMSTANGGDITNFRGVMINPSMQPSDLQYLGQNWKANMIRWQLIWGQNNGSPADNATPEAYDAWLEGALKGLDAMLPYCEQYGVKVLVDLHTTPGGRNTSRENRIFKDAQNQAKFIQVWNKIAARYSGNKTVWGYDLANEPIEGTVGSGLMNWQQLATQVALNIRAVDGAHTIVVAPRDDSFQGLVALTAPVSNVVYTVHMYQPWEFASQGIPPNLTPYRYPGVVKGKMWDKAQVKRVLQPVVDFQKRYGVRIFIGEFSAVRWAAAGSAYNYLKDVISVFEENGWDWTYHAFREWQGWSVEYTENINDLSPSKKQTNREKLLRYYFSKNR